MGNQEVPVTVNGGVDSGEATKGDISEQYETPAPEPFISFNALKDRIRHHYEVCSDYYYSLW
jgi:tocopherol O-methyltransferase